MRFIYLCIVFITLTGCGSRKQNNESLAAPPYTLPNPPTNELSKTPLYIYSSVFSNDSENSLSFNIYKQNSSTLYTDKFYFYFNFNDQTYLLATTKNNLKNTAQGKLSCAEFKNSACSRYKFTDPLFSSDYFFIKSGKMEINQIENNQSSIKNIYKLNFPFLICSESCVLNNFVSDVLFIPFEKSDPRYLSYFQILKDFLIFDNQDELIQHTNVFGLSADFDEQQLFELISTEFAPDNGIRITRKYKNKFTSQTENRTWNLNFIF